MNDFEVGEKPQEKKELTPTELKKATPDLIAKAEALAERLDQGNAKLAELLDRQESQAIQDSFGGKSSAGDTQPKEETPQEYAERIMKNEES